VKNEQEEILKGNEVLANSSEVMKDKLRIYILIGTVVYTILSTACFCINDENTFIISNDNRITSKIKISRCSAKLNPLILLDL
jgi:hypothetical protein